MESNSRSFITGTVRVLFPNLFIPGGKMNKYGIQIILPKTDTVTLPKFRAAIKQAVSEKWPGKKITLSTELLKDGDSEKYEEHPMREAYKDSYFINVGSDRPIRCLDQNKAPLDENSVTKIESGDYCRLAIDVFAFDSMNKGVAAWAKGVQLEKKGERLGYDSVNIDSLFTILMDPTGLVDDSRLEQIKDLL